MNPYQALIGQRIAKIRNELSMTIEHLASQMGISSAALQEIEAGLYSFSARDIVDLALLLDQAPAALIPNARQNRRLVGIGDHFDLQELILRLNTPVCAKLLCSYYESTSSDARDIAWELIEDQCSRTTMTSQ